MPRIRTVKPEFWTDGSNLELSDSCALFFIGLWNFCDDEGKHTYNLNQLVAELGGRWHVGKVKLFISCLVKSGQLRINSTSTWIQVTGWSHQKIDKPKQPKVNSIDLQWLTHEESLIALDESSTIRRKDRIGKDSIGSDRIVATKSEKSEIIKNPSDDSAKAEVGKLASKVIARYCELWKDKYKASAPMHGKWAGNAKTLVKDHGLERSLSLVESFMSMNDSWFIQRRHSFDLILTSIASIAHYSGTGVQIDSRATFNKSNQRTDNNRAAAEAYMKKLEEKV